MAERDELGDIGDQGPWEREDEGSAEDAPTGDEDEAEPEIETFPVPGSDLLTSD